MNEHDIDLSKIPMPKNLRIICAIELYALVPIAIFAMVFALATR